MSPRAKRSLIRLAGFAAGAAVAALWRPPWQQLTNAYQAEAWIWMAVSGAIGVMLVEPWRRSLRDQDALDRAEEDTLDEATMRKLRSSRRWCLGVCATLAVASMLYVLGPAYWSHSPGFSAAMVLLALMAGIFLGQVLLGLDRRQALYARVVQRRRREAGGKK